MQFSLQPTVRLFLMILSGGTDEFNWKKKTTEKFKFLTSFERNCRAVCEAISINTCWTTICTISRFTIFVSMEWISSIVWHRPLDSNTKNLYELSKCVGPMISNADDSDALQQIIVSLFFIMKNHEQNVSRIRYLRSEALPLLLPFVNWIILRTSFSSVRHSIARDVPTLQIYNWDL